MRKESGAPLYILSLSQPKEQTEELIGRILGRPVTAVQGCYEGILEWSVLVPSEEMSASLRSTLAAYEQRCVLYLDGQRNAFLCPAPHFDSQQESEYIGELVSKDSVGSTQSYTLINGLVYYVR